MRRIQYARILRALLYIIYIVSRARVRSQGKTVDFFAWKEYNIFYFEEDYAWEYVQNDGEIY